MVKRLFLSLIIAFFLGGILSGIVRAQNAQDNRPTATPTPKKINVDGAQGDNPSSASGQFTGENFFEGLPFDAEGVTCGVPGGKTNNRCCEQGDFLHPTRKQVDDVLTAIKTCTANRLKNGKCFTAQEGNLLSALLLVGDPNKDNTLSEDGNTEVGLALLGYLGTDVPLKDEPRGNEAYEFLRNAFPPRGEKINKLSSSDQLKLRVRVLFVEDKCIGPFHSFCFRGFSEFFAGLVGDNASIAYILNGQASGDPAKCIYGDAVGEGRSCKCVLNRGVEALCDDYIKNTREHSKCISCYKDRAGVWTGIGCVPISATSFIQNTLLGWGVSLAGLVALLCIFYSAFLLQTSRGNPERIKKAREYLTNCIIGLALVIFSIFILRLIGVDILRIPGFF